MSQSDNYIKVKSRRQLQREVREAQLIIKKAGTSTTLPGATHMPSTRTIPTGVLMPGAYEVTELPNGDPLSGTTTHSWSASAGIGGGNVPMPELKAAPSITSAEYNGTAAYDEQLRMNMKLYDGSERGSNNAGFIFDAANDEMPGSSGSAGVSKKENTQGSVGRDIDKMRRFRRILKKFGVTE